MEMPRLVEEFSHILIENRIPLERQHFSFQSSNDDMSFMELIAFVDREISKFTQVRPQADNTKGLKEYIIDLVDPNVIPDLKLTADIMLASCYAAECRLAYIRIRKDALEECLDALQIEKLSTKDVLEMDWSSLNSTIKKWVRAMKIFVHVYLASEKSLAQKVFGVSGPDGQNCFIEASTIFILQLLRFGEAVAIRNNSPERIFSVLCVSDGLVGILPNLHVWFSNGASSSVSTEAQEVLSRLGACVRISLNKFRNSVRIDEPSIPFTEGGVHRLTVHVMNYLNALTDWSDTLNTLLEGGKDDHSSSSSSSSSSLNVSMAIEDGSLWSSSHGVSRIARYLQLIISILESNLESKSQIYTDVSQQHFFLMNNLSYVELNVRLSKLGPLLGDYWIRKLNEKIQQHIGRYGTASWGTVLFLLDCEGICDPHSGSVSKGILKERIRRFNLAFEEIYRTQTTWLIYDDQVREDQKISISSKVLQLYRTFLELYSNQLAGERRRYGNIKYSLEDLKGFLLDLFEGTPRSLHNSNGLKEVFSRVLIENKLPFEPKRLSLQSNFLLDLIGHGSTQARHQRDNTKGMKEYIIDLVHPKVIPDLKHIVEVMFASGYDAECCQAYINIRKDALQECLHVLEVENLAIKDVLEMDWSSLKSMTKKWIRAVKIFVHVYLASEKILAHLVFGGSGAVGQTCYIEASKSLILQLLCFYEDLTIKNHLPENISLMLHIKRILLILHMYDGFVDFICGINVLFSNEADSSVSTEAHKAVGTLGVSVRRSLNEFKHAVTTDKSSTPFDGGGVHPLTIYVMKYLGALADNSDTLNFLLDGGGDNSSASPYTLNTTIEADNAWSSSSSVSPMARHLQSMISILETNLKTKSLLYTDVFLQHFFLMNNISYIAQKMNDSELQPLLGEEWIRKQDSKFQQHAINYENASWRPVLFLLRDEGICNPESDAVHKAILKVRFQCFNLAFEEIYRTQTAWWIHNDKLRNDLRISISLKVLRAYQTFLGSYSYQLTGEKHSDSYLKYSVEDLKKFLVDLFAGSPRSLPKSRSLVSEFRHILTENKKPLKPEFLPLSSTDDDMSFMDLITSVDDEPFKDTKVRPQRDDKIIDLVLPNAIPHLKCIAEVMFASGCETECFQSYISIRKIALDECLSLIGFEKLSIKDVLQMNWGSLNSTIKKWVQVVKFTHVYLSSEKSLADKVFGVSRSVLQIPLIEASKGLILQLLSFGEAVAIRNYSPEKILPILNMCDGLLNLLPDIDAVFVDEAGSRVSSEAHEVIRGLGESVMRTLNLFRNAVRTNELTSSFAGGGVHHLTKYVMKYLKALTHYSYALNFILEGCGDDDSPSSSAVNTAIDDDDQLCSSHSVSPVARFLQSMVSVLESNLKSKSQLYTNVSLQHFFLMNNIHYMAQKVKDSELQPLLGENWMMEHNGKIQQHSANYEIICWRPVLYFLRHEGICNPGSVSFSKAILKERFQGFNLAFEEIYRSQTAWLIENHQLRQELRISVSSKVLVEYRSFLERYSSQLAAKYIKYSEQALEKLLSHLFEGSPKTSHKTQRR